LFHEGLVVLDESGQRLEVDDRAVSGGGEVDDGEISEEALAAGLLILRDLVRGQRGHKRRFERQ
jgi:hypothetical protein